MDLGAFWKAEPGLSRREMEGKAVRLLLQHMFKESDCGLYYDAYNKPHIRQPQGHISITHSHERLAILFNRMENTGIDIERIRDKVKAIQHKYLSEEEQRLANNETETLVLFWAIKESLYKVHGKKGLDFKTQLFIREHRQNPMLAGIRLAGIEELYRLRKEKLDEYLLVYVENKV